MPVHKKDDEQIQTTYCPVSLLLICGKTLWAPQITRHYLNKLKKSSFMKNNNSTAHSFIFRKRSRNQNFTTKTSWINFLMKRKIKVKQQMKEKISKLIRVFLFWESCKISSLENRSYSINRTFISPHLDYDDVVYHQPSCGSFCQKIEFIQYQAALGMAGAIHENLQT